MYRKLKINPDFQNLIAPLSDEEFKQLEENILAHGRCRDAIKVWRNFIIDGHNRYAICQKHKTPYDVQEIRLSSKEDAKLWIADNQLGRRNISKAIRIELACLKTRLLREKAKENNESFTTRQSIAKIAGVSEQTVHKYMKIAGSGAPELIERVKKGELKISTAHKDLQMQTRKSEVIYDDSDPQFRNSPMCKGNVFLAVGRIDEVYGWLNEPVLQICGGDGVGRVLARLKGQLKVVAGIESVLND